MKGLEIPVLNNFSACPFNFLYSENYCPKILDDLNKSVDELPFYQRM